MTDDRHEDGEVLPPELLRIRALHVLELSTGMQSVLLI